MTPRSPGRRFDLLVLENIRRLPIQPIRAPLKNRRVFGVAIVLGVLGQI